MGQTSASSFGTSTKEYRSVIIVAVSKDVHDEDMFGCTDARKGMRMNKYVPGRSYKCQ